MLQNTFSKFTLATFVGGAFLASSGLALAQDPCSEDPCSEDPCSADPCSADPCSADPCGDSSVEGAVATTSAEWPLSQYDRPLTLPAGVFGAGGSVGASGEFKIFGLEVGGAYGVSNELTVGASYGLNLEPSSDGKGPFSISGAYTFYSAGTLNLAGTGGFTYNVLTEKIAIEAGVAYWYNIGDSLTIFGGGNQLAIGLDPSVTTLSLPVAVGFQLNPNTFLSGGTTLMAIGLSGGGGTAIFGADMIPLEVGAIYSPSNTLDVGVSISSEAKVDLVKTLAVTASVTYYGGSL